MKYVGAYNKLELYPQIKVMQVKSNILDEASDLFLDGHVVVGQPTGYQTEAEAIDAAKARMDRYQEGGTEYNTTFSGLPNKGQLNGREESHVY